MDDFRGGGPPPWQAQPAPQAAAQLPPSLLQMAQGQAPQLSDDMRGGGGLGFTDQIPFGAEVRPITSPQDQNWSDAQGNPIHVGGAAPAYSPGTIQGGFPSVFAANAPSANGGWFTMNDYLKDNPINYNVNHAPPPHGNALSTNNWRLLPEGFRDPDRFMINGTVVSRRQAQTDLAPKSVLGVEGGGHPGYRPMGGGMWSMPTGSYAWNTGYIGSDPTNWNVASTPTY